MSWQLRVRDRFSAAHYLREYQGKCEKVHGHTFQVEAVVEAKKLDAAGIGIDFARIKAALAKDLPVIEVTVWESEDASATYTPDR